MKKAYQLDKAAAFYYNGLVTDEGDKVFDVMPAKANDVLAIAQANFLGMSTTAINLNKLSYEFLESLKEGDCKIFDWYLFSRILLDVGYGVYVEDAQTVYRIHENNTVGVSHDIELEKHVKLEHYARLAKNYPIFDGLYKALAGLDLDSIDTTNSHHGYWWSNIMMEDFNEI